MLATGIYFALSQPGALTLRHGESGVLVCPELLAEKETRDDIDASSVVQRALRRNQRYAMVGRVVKCEAEDGGVCDLENGELRLEKPAKNREVVRESGCRLDACADHGKACQTKNRLFIVEPSCVVPNCWQGDAGEWVDDAVVDCQLRSPDMSGEEVTRYVGCNVFPASKAVGTQCVPVSCEVFSGEGASSL